MYMDIKNYKISWKIFCWPVAGNELNSDLWLTNFFQNVIKLRVM
jgi:hypothetical protein